MEYELQLLDARSLDLVDGILPLLEEIGPTPYIKSEYNQYTVEVACRPCRTVAGLHERLLEQVRRIHKACGRLGMKLAGAGTHPFCTHLAHVTPGPRYRKVEKETGYAGYTQIAYATHVHVGVASGPEAIEMMRRLRPYLYFLLGISASSPFFWSLDTGFASFRARLLLEAHTYGTAPELASWEDFEELWRVAKRARIFKTFKDNHWDIRPKPELGTVELRSMDAQPTVRKTVALAALVRALADYLRAYPDESLPYLPLWLEQENRYRCSHRGVEAAYITGPGGATEPVRELALRLLDRLSAVGKGEDLREYLDDIAALVESPGYRRQREVRAAKGALRAVTADLVDQMDREMAS